MSDVFISYSQKVLDPTVELAARLTKRGFRVWYDVNLLPGDMFHKVIEEAIDRAQAVITIWSPPALTSKWVPAESGRALNQNKLICVRTGEVEPSQLPMIFSQINTPLWTETDAICQKLVNMGVRQSGAAADAISDPDQLMAEAQRVWQFVSEDDAEALEAFLEEYGALAMFRRMARKRLDALRSRAEEPAVSVSLAAPPRSSRPQDREPPPIEAKDVLLRLDPGMHTAKIGRIDVSADGRLLATASHDKTLRLWRLPEGKLIRTLRPPVGEGNEGKVYAVALDPAGRWVAAGGWTSKSGTDEFVTLFEVETGVVRARLGPLPNPVSDLAASPDGARLAAGLSGSNGIRVWDSARALRGDPDALLFEARGHRLFAGRPSARRRIRWRSAGRFARRGNAPHQRRSGCRGPLRWQIEFGRVSESRAARRRAAPRGRWNPRDQRQDRLRLDRGGPRSPRGLARAGEHRVRPRAPARWRPRLRVG
jgi:hypothetical protein